MKNLLSPFIFCAFLCLYFSCHSQEQIDKKDVERMIKKLSSDEMQGRKIFTEGNDKAAAFIKDEFKNIGLSQWGKAEGFEDVFTGYTISPSKISVMLNGKSIDSNNVIVIGTAAEINLESGKTKAEVVGKDKDLYAAFGSLKKKGEDALLVVDPAHEGMFSELKSYFGKDKVVLEKKAQGSIVIILDKTSSVESFSVKIQQKVEEKKGRNIVGMIPGKTKKDEWVVFSSHYDHIGILEAVNGDSIANGADDDASGTTAVMALARYFKKLNNNERTLVFVAFTGEEVGGFGSQNFSKQLKPEQIVAMFNIEMIGKESKFGVNAAFITGFEKSDFGKILQKNVQGSKFTFHPDPYPEQDLFYRSDNATLAKLGVPAHTISTDQIDSDKNYHTVDDEFETINIENLKNTIEAIIKGSQSIIQGKDTPSRIK